MKRWNIQPADDESSYVYVMTVGPRKAWGRSVIANIALLDRRMLAVAIWGARQAAMHVRKTRKYPYA